MARLSRRQFVVGAAGARAAGGVWAAAGAGAAAGEGLPDRLSLRRRARLDAPRFEAFRQGLRELGWIEGQNLTVEHRVAEGQASGSPSWPPNWSSLQPDVIVANGELATRAARNATRRSPSCFPRTRSGRAAAGGELRAPGRQRHGRVRDGAGTGRQAAGAAQGGRPTVARVGAIFNSAIRRWCASMARRWSGPRRWG